MTAFRHDCADGARCWLTERWNPAALGQTDERVDGRWPFPRGISPGDLDSWIECNGHLLFIETKGAAAVGINEGQRRALSALSHVGMVIVQVCDPPALDRVVKFRTVRHGIWHPYKVGDALARDRLVQAWFRRAEAAQAA